MGLVVRAVREARSIWSRWKAFAVIVSVVVSGFAAYRLVFVEQAAAGGSLMGSTAWDIYFVMLNDQRTTALLIPCVCLFVCGDVLSGDRASGMDSVVLVRLRNIRSYWMGKIAVVFLTCLLVSLLHCLALTIFDAVFMDSTLSASAVPEWLAYKGGVEWSSRTLAGSAIRIPSKWNYFILTACLTAMEGVKYACIVLFFVALCRDSRVKSMPFVCGTIALLAIETLPLLYAQVHFLISDWGGASEGVALTGWISDRLCLGSYALGADMGQTHVGGLALVEQMRREFPDIGMAELREYYSGYRVDSFLGFVVLIASMLLFTLVRLSHLRPTALYESGRVGKTGEAAARDALRFNWSELRGILKVGDGK